MELDRDLQRSILELLKTAYPNDVLYDDTIAKTFDHPSLAHNLLYLGEHGLVVNRVAETIGRARVDSIVDARITARGLDHLQNDGGLSAMLNTVTVRFEADTLRALLANRITASSASEPEKRRFLDQLRSLPRKALDELLQRLVNQSLDAASGSLPALLKLLEGLT